MLNRVLDGVERLGHWVLFSYPDLVAAMQETDTDAAHDPANESRPVTGNDPVYWPFGI